MAATRRGAWKSRVSSTGRGGGDSVQRSPQPYLADYINNNYGISSTTTASGTGTTLSNTSSSSASALAARVLHSFMHAPNTSTLVVEEDADEIITEQDKAKTREHMRDLIHGSADPLDRWLWELQVSWVLHLAQLDASAGRAFVSRRLQHTARSWVLALHRISRCIVGFTGWCPSQDEELEEGLQEQLQTCWPPTSELVGFFAANFTQMLPFVDAVVALEIIDHSSSDDDDHQSVSGSRGGVASVHKFQALADVRDALAGALEHVQLWDSWLCSSLQLHAGATKSSGDGEMMSSLLLAKLDRLDEAIRDTRDYVRAHFMSLTRDHHHHDSTASGPEDLSPGIHKATKSALSCIIVLSTSYKRSAVVDPPTIRVHGKDAPAASTDNENTSSSTNLIMVMVRSLEEKLSTVSESFTDQSLRLLFLINNLYFVWHQLRTNQRLVDVPMYALTHKIDGYINSYMQVSWTPVLKPLHDYTPCCFTRYSAQYKFETKFEKTYATQKLWKVPDPELREELRATIIKKIIPAFTKFSEDVSASRVTPKELEEMLEELFEG